MENDQFQRSPQNSDQLVEEIKDVFKWAFGQSALMEMPKMVREKELNSLLLDRLFASFRVQFIPERNKTITEQTSST